MCIACGVTQIPVCNVAGACGGVSLFAQIITLCALSLSIAIGTASLWFSSVKIKLRNIFNRN